MAIKSTLIRNIKELEKSMKGSISYIDIDMDVRRSKEDPWTTKTRSITPRNNYAILNAYRLWLQSKRYDYVRSPDFGGLFAYNLNDRVTFGPENEDAVRSIVIQESNEKWPDINVLDCQVKAVPHNREWRIRIIAQDKETKMILMDEDLSIPHEYDPGVGETNYAQYSSQFN